MIALIVSLHIENNTTDKLTGFFMIAVTLVIWFVLFIKILKHPGILYGFHTLEKRIATYRDIGTINSVIWKLSLPAIKNGQDKRLSVVIKRKIKEYIEEIELHVEYSKPFRDNTFKMNELGNALNIPRSHIAYLFKYHCKIPFVAYTKYCKIKDAQTLIKEKYLRTNTLESLSKKIGFISYNTFFISFKKQCGISPNKSM
jgi:YesN/AraC family two-component response regulator